MNLSQNSIDLSLFAEIILNTCLLDSYSPSGILNVVIIHKFTN